MRPRRWPLRFVIPAAFAGALALALLVAYRSAFRTLNERLSDVLPPDVVQRVVQETSDAYFGAVFLVLLVGTVAAVVAGSALAAQIERVRAEIIARARGGRADERLRQSPVADIQGLGSAVELLTDETVGRIFDLSRERDELASLVDAVSEGILQIDPEGRVVRANPAATELLGLPRHPRGQAITTLVRNHELRRLLDSAARGGATTTREITLDDQRLLVVSRPFADSHTRGAVIALIDLTELRRLEGVRRDFVANVSHELKTPLTSIRGYVETLLGAELPAETQRQFLDIVQKNAERLHRLVEDLLDLSRLESGGWRPELRAVDPLATAHEAWTSCAERAAAKSLTFRAEGDALLAVADPEGLRQVFNNLFDNAIRHTTDGGRIDVHAGSAQTRGALWSILEVRDTGSGIPRDALSRVFERFYRVDPARSRAEGGTGLGLSIVKHLIERMGGSVEAISELGKGTTIRIRLPASQPPHEDLHIRSSQES